MAHELSIVNVNGQQVVEAMYANRPAWHGLGEIFDAGGRQAPDSAEAMRLAHLDWRVLTEPLHLADSTEVPGWFATVRSDNREILGVVTGRYQVVQNVDAFGFMDSLLMDGIMRYESAMALRGGRTVVLLARMPSVDTIAENDQCLRYIMFSTSHDGTAAIHCLPTSVRVVCANTQRLAIQQGKARLLTIPHVGDVKGRLEIARQYLSQFDRAFTLFRDKAQLLATRQVSQGDAMEYLQQLFPPPQTKENGELKKSPGRDKRLEEIVMALCHPSQNVPAIKGTWWALYNAVTFAVDHRKLAGRGSVAQLRERRFESALDGKGAALKDEAFELACSMAGANLAA